MLDQETKKKINDLRDTLVGKVPDPKSQVEQIMIALIYKFMNDMDKESTDLGGEASFFVGEFEKYSWDNLFGTKVSGSELVDLYSTAVESMEENPNIPQLFRDIFKNAYIPYKDAETLRLFLSQIDDFEYSKDSEQLGDAFEHILNSLSSQGDAGQFRTPRHIIDFIVEIVDPKKDETVLDPASGTSGFLISAFKHIVNSNSEKSSGDLLSATERKKIMKNINGYDISPDMVRIGLANMYLHGFPEPNVVEYDALTSEDRWNEYYDVILANPPFMTPRGGIRPHNRFGIKSTKAEVLFVDYILTHLKPKGRAGIIVPEGIIFQLGKAYVELRKKLVENGLVGVVSLPSGVFNPYSGVKTSILIIDKSKNNSELFFVEIKNDGYSLGANRTLIESNDLPSTLDEIKSEDFSSRFSLIKKSDLNTDYSFNFKASSLEDINSDYVIVELGEHIDVLDSIRKPITKKDRKPGPYPYYGATGIIDYVQDFIFDEEILLLGEDGAKWEAGEKSSFIVDGKSWVNNHAHVIKPKESLNIVFLKEVLNYLDLSKYITGVTVPKLNQKNMLSIKIPLPPLEKQQEIVDEIEQYQKVIDGAKDIISFNEPDIEMSSMSYLKLGDIADITTGKLNANQMVEGGKYPFFTCSKEIFQIDHYAFDCEAILLAGNNASGDFNAKHYKGKFNAYQRTYVITLKDDSLSYEFLLFQIEKSLQKLKKNSIGTNTKFLKIDMVKNISIGLPDKNDSKLIDEELLASQNLIIALTNKINSFENKIQKLINSLYTN